MHGPKENNNISGSDNNFCSSYCSIESNMYVSKKYSRISISLENHEGCNGRDEGSSDDKISTLLVAYHHIIKLRLMNTFSYNIVNFAIYSNPIIKS